MGRLEGTPAGALLSSPTLAEVPMHASVRFLLPDGSRATLHPGDFIGRLWNAGLQLDDARISEAHALVSLRGGELKLLALRGLFAIDGQPSREVALVQGQRVALARGLELLVEAVLLPELVLAMEGPGLPRQVLSGTASLHLHPNPRLAFCYDAEAPAQIWSTGFGWRIARAGEVTQDLRPGDVFIVGGFEWRAVAVPTRAAERDATRTRDAIQRSLNLVTAYDSARICQEGSPPVILGGLSARILSELAAFGASAPWEVVAGEIWPAESDRNQLRRKWDVALARLRGRLREAGLRDDLVSADRSGQVGLLLYDGDSVEDRS
jgi:hypothetical protein